MSWAVGVLTWNRPRQCRATVFDLARHLVGDYRLVVFDNGSDPPFTLDGCYVPGASVVRSKKNLGAGAGMTETVRHLLGGDTEFVLFVEDDWAASRELHLAALAAVCSNPAVGQVRLAERTDLPSDTYWTYALEGEAAQESLKQSSSPFYTWSCGKYQLVRLLWSNNPWACRREVAERFCLTGEHEIAMARPYLASGMLTADTVPGHFRHRGAVKERRGEPGWKR